MPKVPSVIQGANQLNFRFDQNVGSDSCSFCLLIPYKDGSISLH